MVKVSIIGSLRGHFNQMYKEVSETESKCGYKIDIVLCCGDVVTARNHVDTTAVVRDRKYRELGDFWRYYSGELTAPYLTIIVGGNVDAWNYLQELPYGGWLAPNIYYLGYAGVVNVCGLRIAGMSGIYKRYDYVKGHFEHPPYTEYLVGQYPNDPRRSAYHIRNIEALRLLQMKSVVDIMISHDWPRGVQRHSDEFEQLIEFKPDLIEEMFNNTSGCYAGEEVLLHLKPKYWFGAHINFKFTASIQFQDANKSVTRFLGLTPCDPDNSYHYIQFLDIEPSLSVGNADMRLSFDPEWLHILRATNGLMNITNTRNDIPTPIPRHRYSATETDLQNIRDLFGNQLEIRPDSFVITGAIHDEHDTDDGDRPMPILTNPQTDELCVILGLVNPNATFLALELSSQ